MIVHGSAYVRDSGTCTKHIRGLPVQTKEDNRNVRDSVKNTKGGGLYRYSNRGPITIEDNRVHNCQSVHGWKAYTKPMEVVPNKFKYIQKKDNWGSTIEGVYTLVCVGMGLKRQL